MINFDRERLARFETVYKAAVAVGAATFVFDNETFSVKYAMYVIEYLKLQLKD